LSARALAALAEAARDRLQRFHAEFPLKAGMPLEELKRRVFAHAPEGAFERALEVLAGRGELKRETDTVALARHAVRLSPAEETARDALVTRARTAGLAGIDPAGGGAPGGGGTGGGRGPGGGAGGGRPGPGGGQGGEARRRGQRKGEG